MRVAWRGALGLALLLVTALLSEQAAAQSKARSATQSRGSSLVEGSSDAATRREAERSIPTRDLSTADRRKVSAVLSDVTIFRRMPVQVTSCDPKLHHFMITNPDVTVNVWRELGISALKVKRLGPGTFRAVAPDGSTTDFEFLYSDDETQLIYAVGSYQGPIFKTAVTGGALLLLKCGYIRETDGQYYATSRLDMFLRIDSLALGLFSKTVEPMIAKAAESNFVDCSNFLAQLSTACATRPQTIQKLAAKLDLVDADDRDQFALIAANIAEANPGLAESDEPAEEPVPEANPQLIGRSFRLPAATKLMR
jgi:hypothetical protein